MKKLIAWICILVIIGAQVSAFAANAPKAVVDVRGSVVRVNATTAFGTTYGSGFAVGTQSPVRYIITNEQVVSKATSIQVMLNRDNMINATVQTSLGASNLVVLRLDTPIYEIDPIVINDKIVKNGTQGYSLGFPSGASSVSGLLTGNENDVIVSDGIVNSIQSYPYVAGMEPVDVYQINTQFDEATTGGPFVNTKGELIGINTWPTTGPAKVNAAIIAEELTELLDQNGIPYKKASSLAIVKIVLIIAILLLLGAIAFLIIRVMKNNKQPRPVIYGLSGEFAGDRFYITPEGANIGRDASLCQIVLPVDSPKVSRSHCNLRYDPDSKNFIITDLASSNGTFLMNGVQLKPKTPTVLASGTKFYVGDESTSFRVGLEE